MAELTDEHHRCCRDRAGAAASRLRRRAPPGAVGAMHRERSRA